MYVHCSCFCLVYTKYFRPGREIGTLKNSFNGKKSTAGVSYRSPVKVFMTALPSAGYTMCAYYFGDFELIDYVRKRF